MADSKWRVEIYEIKRFRSLKTLTWGFRNFWLRKWGRKIDIFIYKMAGRFKMANWNLRGKQYWSLKFCTWEFCESLSTNACVQYAKFFLYITKVNFRESIYWSSINNLKFLRVRKCLKTKWFNFVNFDPSFWICHLRNGNVNFLTLNSYSQTIKTRKHGGETQW